MAASAYCTESDVYRYAVPAGSFPNPGRLISKVDAGTEILTIDGHGFADDDVLLFRAEGGGSLPTPLVAGTSYYAIVLTGSTFKVAATPGGSAIDLTTAGSRILVVRDLPWAEKIQAGAAEIDDALIGHGVPLEAPYPQSVIVLNAVRAAELMLVHTGQDPGVLEGLMSGARAQFERWRKGAVIRGPIKPPAANLAVSSVVSGTDPRGWVPEGGGIP